MQANSYARYKTEVNSSLLSNEILQAEILANEAQANRFSRLLAQLKNMPERNSRSS